MQTTRVHVVARHVGPKTSLKVLKRYLRTIMEIKLRSNEQKVCIKSHGINKKGVANKAEQDLRKKEISRSHEWKSRQHLEQETRHQGQLIQVRRSRTKESWASEGRSKRTTPRTAQTV